MPQQRQPKAGLARPERDADKNLSANEDASRRDFLVVGVGASAGGLDATRKLIGALPPSPELALILVQHLDPTHESMMVDLLRTHTSMTVIQASEGLAVEINHLYVITPGTYLSVSDGILRLSTPSVGRGSRLPFDFLLNSLATSFGSNAACVILSGTGADGSHGVKSISDAGGLVFAQDPTEAGFDGMPRTAIQTGLVDVILPAAGIAEALTRRARGMPMVSNGRPLPRNVAVNSTLSDILDLLRARTAYDFRLYKHGTLERRIDRRLALSGLKPGQSTQYLEKLNQDPDELESLAKDLLINVTSFFRDEKVFSLLADTVIPELIRTRPVDRPLRVWVAGCSTGEEPYSLAMLLIEAIEKAGKPLRFQIFASDVDPEAVAAARDGLYSNSIESVIDRKRLDRFFSPEGAGYRVRPDLRAAVIFTVQDILSDPPFSRLDLVSCRNVLIYLQPEAQTKVISLFHFALGPSGLLLLGSSETAGGQEVGFATLHKSERIFRRNDLPMRFGQTAPRMLADSALSAKPLALSTAAARHAALAEVCERLILNAYAPASVLINRKGECLYTTGPTDRFLRVAPGKANHDILAMVREALRVKLSLVIQAAIHEGDPVSVIGAEIDEADVKTLVSISVRHAPFQGESLLLVTFRDEPPTTLKTGGAVSPDKSPRVAELEQELDNARRELKAAIRNLEISSEDQKAVNEEARSVTEEYQATNEELLASKEELQSMNEELTTLNSQLHETLDRQRTTSNDLQNVLYSTQVATLFLDNELKIRLFTPASRDLFKVIATDVGRPLADLYPLAPDDRLLLDAERVLADQTVRSREIQAQNGAWYLRMIVPYLTLDGKVEGVVITFTDISESRQAAAAIEAARKSAEQSNAAKSRFLAAASHDLRQPLQTLSLIHGLLAKTVEGDRAKRLVARLDDTLGAMAGMLNAMLDINQIEAGVVQAEHKRFAIGAILSRLRDEFAYHAHAQGLRFRVVGSGLWIVSDERLLEQMLRNLIANALKYTRTGSILVGCRRRSGSLRVEVWDTGIGIPANDLQVIFEEFHQLDNEARERSLGLGLGLSIVRRLGALLDHEVSVRSTLGKGSIFSVQIKSTVDRRPPSTATALAHDNRQSLSPRARGSILVIEDDPTLREILEVALRQDGHTVSSAPDGAAALAQIRSGAISPDLLLADYNLPGGLNGLQTASRIRKELGRQASVIILTGDISTGALKAIALEDCVQLNKPAKLGDLADVISELLANTPPAAIPSSPKSPIGQGPLIYLVDDDADLRSMLREVLEQDGRQVEDYGDCETFLAAWRPEVEACLLIDAGLPGLGGLDLLRRLKAEGRALPSIMITGNSDVPMAVEAMKAGASDFLEKPVRREELLSGIQRALDGAKDSGKIAAAKLAAAAQMEGLTERQREIMSMVLAGHPSKNIAADLGISQRTVENHRAAIMKKTGSRSLPALARLALAADSRAAETLSPAKIP